MKKYSQIIYLVIAVICLITFVFAFFDMISFFSIIKKVQLVNNNSIEKVLLTRAICLFIIGIIALVASLFLVFVNKDNSKKLKILKLIISIVLIVLSILAIYFINYLSRDSLKITNTKITLEGFNAWLILDSATKGMFIPIIITSTSTIVKLFIK